MSSRRGEKGRDDEMEEEEQELSDSEMLHSEKFASFDVRPPQERKAARHTERGGEKARKDGTGDQERVRGSGKGKRAGERSTSGGEKRTTEEQTVKGLRRRDEDDDVVEDDEDGAGETVGSGDGGDGDDADRALIRCRFVVIMLATVGDDPGWADRWRNPLPPETTLDQIEREVRERLVCLLQQDQRLLRRLRKDSLLLSYQVAFMVQCCGEHFHGPKESRHRFETIGDFYRVPGKPDFVLNVRVRVEARQRPLDVENQDIYVFNYKKKPMPASYLIAEAQTGEPGDRHKYGHMRLGTAAKPKDKSKTKRLTATDLTSSNSSTKDDAADLAPKGHGVPVKPMLVGRWNSKRLKGVGDLDVTSVEAWDFEHYAIGDVSIATPVTFLPDADTYFGSFAKVNTDDALLETVIEHRDYHAPELGCGIPFMPSHTLNDFDSHTLGTGVRLDGGDVHVVIRYIDHTGHSNRPEDDPTQVLSPAWLSHNTQFTVGEQENSPDRIMTLALWELKQHVKDNKLGGEDREMIEDLVRRGEEQEWKLQLWVLPQGERKMYVSRSTRECMEQP